MSNHDSRDKYISMAEGAILDAMSKFARETLHETGVELTTAEWIAVLARVIMAWAKQPPLNGEWPLESED